MWTYQNSNELYHHGILGMKWGHQSSNPISTTNYSKVSAKKKAMTDAKAEIAKTKVLRNQAYGEENNAKSASSSLIRKFVPAKTSFRGKADETAKASSDASTAYKQAKSTYKQAKKDYKTEVGKTNENYDQKSITKDRLFMNDGATKQVNKMLNTHKDMTVSQARKTTAMGAGVNTATALLGLYGAYKLTNALGK